MKARLLGCLLALSVGCGSGTEPTNPDPQDTGCGTGVAEENGVCVLAGNLTRDFTVTKDRTWLLRGGVLVGDDTHRVTLTVQPGATIYGEESSKAFIAVQRGSKIDAQGTRDAPIVFTSSKRAGERSRGDWGGIVLNGSAAINACPTQPCEADGEGNSGKYGGSNDADSCGVMKYVRIEFAGNQITEENELNGLALQGCGSGTEIDFVQIHMASDDGIEFFGGTASVRHILLTGISDDNLDWTFGWRGKAQFIVAQQYADQGDNGIEADNNNKNRLAMPVAKPMLSNLTLIGSPASSASDLGVLLREGTGALIANSALTGWNEACLDIDHAETFKLASTDGANLTGELIVKSSVFDCAKPFNEDNEKDASMNKIIDPYDVSAFILTLNTGNSLESVSLIDPLNALAPNFAPKDGSVLTSGFVAIDDPFFENVSYRGGVDPKSDWTQGWTTFAAN